MMAKLHVNEHTFGVTPWGSPTGRPRGRPVTTGEHTTDAAKLSEFASRVRICELDDIIRRGGTLKRAG